MVAHAKGFARQRGTTINDIQTNVVQLGGAEPNIKQAFEWLSGKSDDKYFDIIVHSDGDNFKICIEDKWHSIDQRVLKKYIENNGYKKGHLVRLLACESGVEGNKLAQNVSNKLGSPVLAPNGTLRVHSDGGITIVKKDGTDGVFNKFEPGNQEPVVKEGIAAKGSRVDEFVELGYNPLKHTIKKINGVPITNYTLFRGLKFNKNLDYIWKQKVGDYVMIESKAWKKLGLDPDADVDFSMAQRHTYQADWANKNSPLMSFDEAEGKAESFAKAALKRKEMPYGLLLIIERDEVKYIQKATFTYGDEKEWHVFGPVKTRIVAFILIKAVAPNSCFGTIILMNRYYEKRKAYFNTV